MRFLCVCTYGHSRSVALARCLHKLGHEAVACGNMTGNSAISVLSEWADKILLMVPAKRQVPEACRSKITDMDIGPDRWSNPYHPELASILARLVRERLGLG